MDRLQSRIPLNNCVRHSAETEARGSHAIAASVFLLAAYRPDLSVPVHLRETARADSQGGAALVYKGAVSGTDVCREKQPYSDLRNPSPITQDLNNLVEQQQLF